MVIESGDSDIVRQAAKRFAQVPFPPLAPLTLDTVGQSTRSERVIVLDPDRKSVLFAKNASERRPIASIQKLLAALLLIERGALEDRVEIAPQDTLEDLTCRPMTAGLKPGHAYSRHELLQAMLIGSANDAALALARDHSGSIPAFVDAMNERARLLDMRNSRFCNPNGLPHDGQYSTAEDVATLAQTIDSSPLLRAIVATPFLAPARVRPPSCYPV